MSKHTPGTWTIYENTKKTKNGSYFQIDGHMTHIADVFASTNTMWDFVPGYQTGKANAILIASAPDLLEALIKLVDDFGPTPSDRVPNLGKARAAIAKALGENK